MKHVALITSLLLLSITALAQTYSNANLNGNYSVQFGTPQTYNWSKTFACPTNSQMTYTVNGSQTGQSTGSGVVTFDGNGNFCHEDANRHVFYSVQRQGYPELDRFIAIPNPFAGSDE